MDLPSVLTELWAGCCMALGFMPMAKEGVKEGMELTFPVAHEGLNSPAFAKEDEYSRSQNTYSKLTTKLSKTHFQRRHSKKYCIRLKRIAESLYVQRFDNQGWCENEIEVIRNDLVMKYEMRRRYWI